MADAEGLPNYFHIQPKPNIGWICTTAHIRLLKPNFGWPLLVTTGGRGEKLRWPMCVNVLCLYMSGDQWSSGLGSLCRRWTWQWMVCDRSCWQNGQGYLLAHFSRVFLTTVCGTVCILKLFCSQAQQNRLRWYGVLAWMKTRIIRWPNAWIMKWKVWHLEVGQRKLGEIL